jgi:hypothetical protein
MKRVERIYTKDRESPIYKDIYKAKEYFKIRLVRTERRIN